MGKAAAAARSAGQPSAYNLQYVLASASAALLDWGNSLQEITPCRILVIENAGEVFALANKCSHMGLPLVVRWARCAEQPAWGAVYAASLNWRWPLRGLLNSEGAATMGLRVRLPCSDRRARLPCSRPRRVILILLRKL